MNILVTGGAGFIGSHLAERLLGEGHEITIVDNLNDFYSPDLKRRNLDEIRRIGAFRFYEIDICDLEKIRTVFSETRPDAVIHLAARTGVRPSLVDPLLYEKVNVQGTLALLEACRKSGTKKFILGSSSSVYGEAARVPFREDDPVNRPISPYAATKAAAEKLCYTYSHLYGIQVICLRFFTVYGPRQRPDLAIRKFTEFIHQGRPIPVFGDGQSGRDYTFVDDIVQGVESAVSYDAAYDIINLGNSHPVKLDELIRTIERSVGKKAIINRMPEQAGDVPLTYADIGKAKVKLHYQPSTSFPDGIEKFVRWYLSRELSS